MVSQSDREHLTPVGKLKGEIEDEFEALYLAKDKSGRMYMNRNPEYAQDRYDQAKGWTAITPEQLKEYKEKLHFIPHKNRRLKP